MTRKSEKKFLGKTPSLGFKRNRTLLTIVMQLVEFCQDTESLNLILSSTDRSIVCDLIAL